VGEQNYFQLLESYISMKIGFPGRVANAGH